MPQQTEYFSYFSKLPTEIRLMIWALCIPRRVIEMDLPLQEYRGRNCPGHAAYYNTAPPVVTRVCRESRAVALANGGPVKDGGTGTDGEPLWEASSSFLWGWFSPKYDVVHYNRNESSENCFESVGSAFDRFAWLADKASGGSLEAWTVYKGLSYMPWIPDRYPVPKYRLSHPNIDLWTFDMLATRKEYYVVLESTELHISEEQARKSGLFGHLGDSRVQLLDVGDAELIRKYYNLWKEIADIDDGPREFFDIVLGKWSAGYAAQVQQWREEADEEWLWCSWRKDLGYGHYFKEEYLNDERLVPQEEGSQYLRFDMEHPWTQKTWAGRWKIKPVLMIRWCDLPCYQEETAEEERARRDGPLYRKMYHICMGL